MLRRGTQVYYFTVVLLFVVFILNGCYKFDGDETIPAYISIDKINLNTYYSEEGTNSSDIDDVWIYLDDGLIGVFEFPESDTVPLIFPALASGKHKLEIRPGIKLNGISSTRVPYPFYKPIIYEDFDFIPGTTQPLGILTTEYYSDAKFAWLEDFEQSSISFENFDDTIIEQTQPENNPIAFLSPDSRYSGEINLTTERSQYSGASYNSFDVPVAGTITILEINFKTNNYLQVGLLIRDQYGLEQKDLVILNHSSEWTKIYINLGSNLSLFPSAIDYKVWFRAGLESDLSSAKILIDNIKVVYR